LGETKRPSTTTFTLELGGLIVVVKGVPASVCENCGEAHVDEKVATELLKSAERTVMAGARVEIRQYVSCVRELGLAES